MATANYNLSDYDLDAMPDGSSYRIHLVVSQWNNTVTTALCNGAIKTLNNMGLKIRISKFGKFLEVLSWSMGPKRHNH